MADKKNGDKENGEKIEPGLRSLFVQAIKIFWAPVLLIFISLALYSGLGSATGPLLFSFALAYLVFPLIQKSERMGISRRWTILMSFFCLVGLGALLGLLFIPPLIDDFKEFSTHVPEYLDRALQRIEILLTTYGLPIHLNRSLLIEHVRSSLGAFDAKMVATASSWVTSAASHLMTFILSLLNSILAPVFFFYLIMDWEKLNRGIRSLIPPHFRQQAQSASKSVDRVLSAYIRGQLLVSVILALLYSAALSIVGLPFAVIVGIFTGFASVIPYVGFSLGVVAAVFITLADFSWSQMIAVLIALFTIQTLESFVITPKIVGDRVGLNSLEVILFMIVFGNLFGFVGLLVAIPAGSILKLAMRSLLDRYRKSPAFY